MKKNRKLNLRKVNIAKIEEQMKLQGGQRDTTLVSIFNMCRTKRTISVIVVGGICQDEDLCR